MNKCYSWHPLRGFYLLLLIHYLFTPPALTQEYLVSVQHYSVPDGLSDRNVRDGLQDSQGFIWAATYDGINRFDGFEFHQYTTEKDGLSAGSYEQVIEDRSGLLWLTYLGQSPRDGESAEKYPIDLFDPATGTVTSFEKAFSVPFSAKNICTLMPGGQGDIYIVLQSGEVYRYDGFAFKYLLMVPIDGACHLAVSGEGLVGLLNGNRLTQFDSLGKIHDQASLPVAGDFIRAANGRFWVGKNASEAGPSLWSARRGQEAQPFYFLDKQGRPVHYHWDNNFETPVYPDHEGRWWVFSRSRLLLFDSKGKLLHDFSADLKEFNLSFLTDIYFDKRNTAWVGTSQGLFSASIRKNPFTNYLTSEYLTDTRGIAPGEKGQVYVVQQGKAWKLDDASGAATEIGVPAWLAAARDTRSNLWFGDYNYKVFFYNPISGEKETYSPAGATGENQFNAIRAIFPDANSGRIWVGMDKEGLAFIDTLRQAISPYTVYNQFQQLQKARIHCFLEDGAGFWLGTNQGLYRLEPGKGIVAGYSQQTGSLPFDDIYHIHKDAAGTFWLATNGGGLIRWNQKDATFRQFTHRNGLSNDVIYAVYEDEVGQLWLPSNYGLMRFDKRSFQVNTYLPRDGIPHEEFNFSSHYQAADGRLYFGGLKGVTAFYPKELYQGKQEVSPKLGVSQYLELDGLTGAFVDKTMDMLPVNKIKLAPQNKSFILKILFPDYQSPKDNRFAYRIEGLHENWVYQESNAIRINALPYGSFTLHVKAQGANGRWSTRELALPLTVVRPFYLRWWFVAACIALGISLIWWRIQALQQAARKLEIEVKKRTLKIEQAKQLIEEQSAELRQLDELKSRFFANMAHELRTPLTLILGPLKKLLKDPGMNDRFSATLKLIQSNANGLMRLAEEILDMDKLEAHALVLQEETVAFYPLVQRLVYTFESHAQANGILLQFIFQADKSLQLRLDVKKLERILFNLLSNALKFTGRGGKVSVTIRETEGRIRILVMDTGRGIHPDDLPHIFGRFYQAKHQGGQAEGGAGIGLALAHEYAQLLEGTLTAESRLDEGSTFVLEFSKNAPPESDRAAPDEIPPMPSLSPATRQETLPVTASDGKQDQGTTPTQAGEEAVILLAEDNSDMRLFLQDMLSPPYRVLAAVNGVHALEQLESLTPGRLPELIVTDIMMPEMDGFTLIRRLKSKPEWQGIPVIALTARAGLDDRLTALRIGVDDYLAKPFEPVELLTRISNLLQNYRRREQPTTQSASFPRVADQSKDIVSVDQQWLAELEAIAFENIGKPDFSIGELAHLLHLSDRHLRRKLKQLTGLSPADYLREIRLQHARRLLENRACHNVAGVGYAIGISTPRHFSRLFKARFGRNPSSYF